MAEITASSISYLLFTILIGLSIPLCLYSVAKFYSFKNDVRFRKRHGKLSMFTALCFISELFSGCLLTLAFSGFASRNTSITLAWFGDILNIVSYFLIIHCLVLRFWMLYFDIRYQIAIRDNVWKSIIDEHYVANEENLSSVKFNIEDDSDDLWFIKNNVHFINIFLKHFNSEHAAKYFDPINDDSFDEHNHNHFEPILNAFWLEIKDNNDKTDNNKTKNTFSDIILLLLSTVLLVYKAMEIIYWSLYTLYTATKETKPALKPNNN
eukprot:462658_1